MTWRDTALAKINLYLDVVGRRPDGYHDIRSVMLPLGSPCDTICIRALDAPGVRVTCTDPDVPTDRANLCWRAAEAFAEAVGSTPAWAIHIEKRIPVAAGMGGGSSDAAAVLRILARHGGLDPRGPEISSLAFRLGADVTFFLAQVPALAEGIGERLRPVTCSGVPEVVLVNPRFPVSAAWAYGHLGRVAVPPAPPVEDLLAALAGGRCAAVAAHAYNALEYAVLDKFPLVGMIRDALLSAGCLTAHVSGSGPTVFGLCAPGQGAQVAAAIAAGFGASVRVMVSGVSAPGSGAAGEAPCC